MKRSYHTVAAVLVTVGFAAPASAGMTQDLASCTAAEGRSSAAACTRVMNSGRLPREQFYIGHFNRGTAYRRAGDFEKALADFEKVVALNPRFARGFHARGLVHDDLGAREEALADIDRAIKIDRQDWSAYYSRAVLLRAKQDFDGALADLDKAIALKPGQPQVQLLRALLSSDKGEYAAARAEINKVVSEGRDSAGAHYARAAVAFEERRLDAAEADLDKALNLRESFAAAHLLMGRILEARGDKAAAKARYRQAAAAEPADHLEGRVAQRTARERLDALGGVSGADVALNERSSSLGCKRFLPATGTIISADCGK
jgi:tetratricopeptide (TPR) repeat protein